MERPTVGRFAPTPSGRMHLGNLYSALLAWCDARSTGGTFLLRIEDLDPERCYAVFAEQLKDDLRWLGLDWDAEQPAQSTRSDAYRAAFDRLDGMGLIYPCYCSRRELHAASAPHRTDGCYVYPGTCRNLTAEDRARMTRPPAWRVRVPDEVRTVSDLVQGDYTENLLRDCGDFTVRRADGVYAYQLAVVVDDAAGGVTRVVRGADLLSSAPRQRWLFETLGLPVPEFAHVPLLVAPDGRRLSKRDGDLDLDRLKVRFSPEALTGLLAHAAGLLPGPEPLTPAALSSVFSWDRVTKAYTVPLDPTIFE